MNERTGDLVMSAQVLLPGLLIDSCTLFSGFYDERADGGPGDECAGSVTRVTDRLMYIIFRVLR